MATRTIWKGAISFGLVHIPVALHTAAMDSGIDFDWLDKRSMDPVGYKRINKRTGKEIDRANIVKGVEFEEGQYAIISPEEIEAAYPRTSRTIEIERFVEAAEVSFVYLERPYYIEPVNGSQKVYALLRDTLAKAGKIGIAKVVIQTKQHLAALVASGDALVLNLMRWGDEVKAMDGLDLPAAGSRGNSPTANEMKMARLLVEDMTGPWRPQDFKDGFRSAIMNLVKMKVAAGKTEAVFEPQEEAPPPAGNVIDLTELLRRSLKSGGPGRTAAKGAAGSSTPGTRKPACKTAGRKASARASRSSKTSKAA